MVYIGKVYYVTDGDSLKVILPFNNGYTRFDFRVWGIDTP